MNSLLSSGLRVAVRYRGTKYLRSDRPGKKDVQLWVNGSTSLIFSLVISNAVIIASLRVVIRIK